MAACVDLGIEPEEAARRHDEIRIELALQEQGVAEVWGHAQERYFFDASRAEVTGHALDVTLEEGYRLLRQDAHDAVEDLLRRVPRELGEHERLAPLHVAVGRYPLPVLCLWAGFQARLLFLPWGRGRVLGTVADVPPGRGLFPLPTGVWPR